MTVEQPPQGMPPEPSVLIPGRDGGIAIVRELVDVAAKVGPVAKAEEHGQGYKYRGIETIMAAIAEHLNTAGIVPIPSVRHHSTVSPAEGKTRIIRVVVDYYLVSATDGSMLVASMIGEGADGLDKASSKALTAAYKYLWLEVLKIGEGMDDTDHVDRAEEQLREQGRQGGQQRSGRSRSGSRGGQNGGSAPRAATGGGEGKITLPALNDLMGKLGKDPAGAGPARHELCQHFGVARLPDLAAEQVSDAYRWVAARQPAEATS